MKRTTFAAAFLLATVLLLGTTVAQAQPAGEYIVRITNLTKSQIFSPPLVASHKPTVRLFTPGTPALPELAILAEDGSPTPLADLLATFPGRVMETVAATGPVLPGKTVELRIQAGGGFNRISALGMLIQTNDAFFAVQNVRLPKRFLRGIATAVAYDAGSEANNESCDFIPGPPCGSGGVRATDGAEGFVYVSNGIHGIGDLPAASYDWHNPVARVVIERVR